MFLRKFLPQKYLIIVTIYIIGTSEMMHNPCLDREKKQGRASSSCHFSDQYFLVFYVNFWSPFSKTRIEYFNIKTREMINVSTITVVHYFSQWAFLWRICDCKFIQLVPSQTPSRSSHWRCSVKKLFLKICETLQENTCVGVFFNKVVGLQIYLKKTPTQVFLKDCFCPLE